MMLFSGSAFAGERTVTLSCGSPIAQDSGDYYEGSAANLKVVLNTDRTVKVSVQSYAVAPNAQVRSTPGERKGDFGNHFVTPNGDKIYLFRESNCLEGSITAILINGNATISNCVQVKSDKLIGSDFDFCN